MNLAFVARRWSRTAHAVRRPANAFHSSSKKLARVLATDGVDESCIAIFKERGHQIDFLETKPEAELCKIIGDYDGLVVRSATKVTPEVLKHATNMRIIGRAGVGIDNINLKEATQRGIMVMNTPGGNTISTAQLALSLMASIARKLPQADASVKAGKWTKKDFMGVELQGKTLGIVGCGRIGQVVAEGAKAIGMKVLGYDPVMTGDGFKEVGLTQATLDQIWEKSDFITFHTPLTPDTKDMLNDVTIAKCKKGVRVINCARGGIINEAALLRGLESGHIAGAGLDVFTSEPPSKDEALTPLLAHPNLICTPHLGASTEEAQLNVAKDIAVQMCDAFDDQQGLTAPDYYFSVVNANYLAASNKPHMPPFVSLAETIGRMQAQIIVDKGSPIKSVVLKTIGARDVNITDKKTRTLLEASMLKGILRHYLSIVGETKPEAKNLIPDLISSPSIAKDVGIESIISGDAPSTNSRSFTNLISVDVELENGTKTNITGAVVGSVPHIVKVDQMEATFKPESNFIVTFRNEDRPGAILEVLNVLSREKVNVGSMSLARSADGTLAQSFVFLDNDITDNGLQMLQSNPTLHNVSRIYLG